MTKQTNQEADAWLPTQQTLLVKQTVIAEGRRHEKGIPPVDNLLLKRSYYLKR